MGGSYLAANAGVAIMQPVTPPGALSPWAGLTVFIGYAAVVLTGAAVTLRRRHA